VANCLTCSGLCMGFRTCQAMTDCMVTDHTVKLKCQTCCLQCNLYIFVEFMQDVNC
jgi:hypothetical protein